MEGLGQLGEGLDKGSFGEIAKLLSEEGWKRVR